MNNIKLSFFANELTNNAPTGIAPEGLVLKRSYELISATRASGEQNIIVDVSPKDLLEIHFDDDTQWLCPPDTLEELFPGSGVKNRSGESLITIPAELASTGNARSLLGNVRIKLLNIFTKNAAKKATDKIAREGMQALAKKLEATQLEHGKGLMKIDSDFVLREIGNVETSSPALLFIHGTNSSTYGSFAEIKNTKLWDYIVGQYNENNILAFQHETLTKSPLQNAAELIAQLPDNMELHVITHSRGGLVGEVLGRYSDGSVVGFSAEEVAMLKDEGRDDDLNQILTLQKVTSAKNYSIKKFIRVACPAAGTSILSKRLDYFLNISLNLLGFSTGLAANPIYQAMRNLLIAAVDQKNDVEGLPGLEAMKPDSPFINIINNQASSVSLNAPVVAISGNCKAKINLKALVIIASKLFYLEDNDLVVNTRSMYNGSKRMSKLQFFFDEGSDVDHFHYFKNNRTNEAILLALKNESGLINGFTYYSRGTVSELERNAVLKLEGGAYASDTVSGNRPIAIVIPGIMGSTLQRNDDFIWINYLRFLSGGLKLLNLKNDLAADYVIKTSYRDLGEELKKTYDVVTFPFDWRYSLKRSAKMLKDKVEELLRYRQPIKIIGHSMGGVLVRDFMVFYPETWQRLNQMPGFQLLFLGSPLLGSYRINSVLFGEDDIINKLSKIDIVHSKRRLIEMFVNFPGILCLLPFSTDVENDFTRVEVWENMRNAFGDKNWILPSKETLADFKSYRDAVLSSKDIDYSNASYVAGKDKETPCGYEIRETARGKELVFLVTSEGDQSVTWATGIPEAIKKQDRVYYVNYSHGALSCAPELFNGIKEILAKGSTTLFSAKPAMSRGERVRAASPTTDFDYSIQGLTNTLLGIRVQEKTKESTLPLKVSVTHGDLKFSRYPVLAGHFENDGILNAEKRIDYLLNRLLSQHHQLNLYPGPIGSHQLFLGKTEDFKGAIILGLGELGALNGFDLTRSVEMSMLKYLMDLVRNADFDQSNSFAPLGISSLIIACGYGGLSFDTSISSILLGVENANRQIKAMFPDTYRLVEQVEFVDYYDNNAKNCMLVLKRLSGSDGDQINILIDSPKIQISKGGRRSSFKDFSTDWWTRLVISTEKNKYGDAIGMRFSISTGSAREEFRVIYTATMVVESLLEEISNDNKWDEEKAKAIFTLLIPHEMKDRLRRQGNLLLVVDSFTAGFPWELLHDKSYSTQPLCVNAGMVRQFLTQDSRVNITMATGNQVLIIGDPNLNNPLMQLSGAATEAREVNRILSTHDMFNIPEPLINASPGQIIKSLFSGEYKIIHLAGHGIFDADPEKPSGMLIGENSVLSSAHIAQLDRVPELVFLNCCYLGKTDAASEEKFQSRFRLAANLGNQLINIGVKAVIAAGWAVEDNAALQFCTRFYDEMIKGRYFGDAVKEAREYVYRESGTTNTWGAFQVYGDPFYTFMNGTKRARELTYVLPDEARTDLFNLLSEIRMDEFSEEWASEKLEEISLAIEKAGVRTNKLTEYEARILHRLGRLKEAIEKYDEILDSSEFTISSVEQYCSCRLSYAIQQQKNHRAKNENGDVLANEEAVDINAEFENIIEKFTALTMIKDSLERSCLLASAWKQKIEFTKGTAMLKSIQQSLKYYKTGVELSDYKDLYALTNWIIMEILSVLATKTSLTAASINTFTDYIDKAIKQNANIKNSSDFWVRMGIPNAALITWLFNAAIPTRRKMPSYKDIITQYQQTWETMEADPELESKLDLLDTIIYVVENARGKTEHFSLDALKDFRAELTQYMV